MNVKTLLGVCALGAHLGTLVSWYALALNPHASLTLTLLVLVVLNVLNINELWRRR